MNATYTSTKHAAHRCALVIGASRPSRLVRLARLGFVGAANALFVPVCTGF